MSVGRFRAGASDFQRPKVAGRHGVRQPPDQPYVRAAWRPAAAGPALSRRVPTHTLEGSGTGPAFSQVMSVLVFATGLAVIVVTWVDVVWTTLTLRRGGVLSGSVATAVWRAFLAIHSWQDCPRLLQQAGWLNLMVTLGLWVSLTWAGWILLFAADPTSVVNEQTGEPADAAALIYFAGFAVYTLGVGDYVPNGDLWRVLTPVATINGFVLVTLSVTYLIQVLSAAVGDRQAAAMIASLGSTPDEILATAWDGRNFSRLSQSLPDIAQMVMEHAHQHLAYPVIHFFHEKAPHAALPLQVARLGETLYLLKALRPSNHGVEPFALQSAIAAVNLFVSRTGPNQVPAPAPPPAPDLSVIRNSGLPVPDPREVRRRLERMSAERQGLYALALGDGWKWEDVYERK